MAFEPARDIDQQRKRCRVAFRKAVGAEPLDLLEAGFREFPWIPFGGHAADEFFAEHPDAAGALERRHRAPELVGLAGRKSGADDGDLHRLFLEQRHPQRMAEHVLEFLGRIGHRFLVEPALQIRVHHAALDRAGPDDRHLDHQIIELHWLEPGQHRHLRPALDLEHPDRIGPVRHLEHSRRRLRMLVGILE